MTSYFSQRDPRWRDKLLGYGRTTFGSSGCAITSFANFQLYNGEKDTPLDINETAKKCGAFSGDMLTLGILAKKLGYTYLKTTVKPKEVCIAETDNYKKVGVPQHFFLYKPENGKRVDPLDLTPQWEDNTYKIVSYRLCKPIQTYVKPMALPTYLDSYIPSPEAPQGDLSPVTPKETHPPIPTETNSILSLIWDLIKTLFQKKS